MHIDNEDALFDWLSDELSPITDADPNALAKYVLALVKKPDKGHDELKAFTNEQLNVFLTDHTAPFVDKVFEALTSKSYMPASTAPTSASATAPDLKKEKAPAEKPSKPTAPPGVQKSSSSPSASKAESRPLRKRISPPPSENREKEKQSRDKERRRSRSPRDRRGRATTSRSGRTSSSDRDRHSKRRSRSRSRSSSGSRTPPYKSRSSRRRCKDFEERGYCIRGDQCPYYHGRDPVVVDENALGSMVPLPATAPNFSLPPPGYNPLNPPPPGVVVAAGEYNPEAPALNNYSIPPPPIPGQWQQPHVAAQYVPQSVSSYSQPPPAAAQGVVTQPGSFRGAPRGRGNIRGRGGFARGGFTGAINRDNCTLQVAKIPPEMNTIAKLNEHFATFGTVDNIQVRYNGEIDSALVTYASKFDAGKAYKSPTPVLNNRFIKVFWHNPGGEGSENATGKPSSPTSPPKPVEKPKIATVQESKFVSVAAQNYRKQIQDAKERLTKEKSILSTLVQAQNQHNIILDKWMVKQKELLIKARTSTDETDKKNATKLVKHLHKKIKACKEEVDGILLKISEKSMVVDEIAAQIEELKNPQKSDDSTRKRKAGSDGDEPQSKMSSVVIVRGVTDELVTDLMAHMEKFGEVFDHSVKADDDGLITAVFPFRKTGDALKAMADGKVLNGVDLEMELKTERIEEIPSTDTNMSADQLLAAIPSNLESDEEDDLLND
ncbi:C3H1-type domain-containing protein [Caenorhabditis elegans]|uniref:C3H1-type domain-containing protein n=1 Tax=Caenorhabditis elegans TaxID=6239 RepID=Q10954_CAEEL|nr:C3H1-type domain-containing protein [Caenorhabditis elegans]CCD61517.1 C3H1-type domain-containing protein [Caenorhabditis elegans]|eukprot:NP_498234.1 RNA Binding Motif protein homolog [Caenorhabditis elegans]